MISDYTFVTGRLGNPSFFGTVQELADLALGITTEQHAMWCDTGHGAPLVEVVYHVQDKGIVRF